MTLPISLRRILLFCDDIDDSNDIFCVINVERAIEIVKIDLSCPDVRWNRTPARPNHFPVLIWGLGPLTVRRVLFRSQPLLHLTESLLFLANLCSSCSHWARGDSELIFFWNFSNTLLFQRRWVLNAYVLETYCESKTRSIWQGREGSYKRKRSATWRKRGISKRPKNVIVTKLVFIYWD